MLDKYDLEQTGQLFEKKMCEKLEPINKTLEGIDKRSGIIEQEQPHINITLVRLASKRKGAI